MEGMFDTCLGFYVLASVVFVSIDKNLARQKCWETYPALLGFVLNTVGKCLLNAMVQIRLQHMRTT